ncbi:hypothetical protein [Luteolibacter soli]|uniref:DUF2059 domain-containing protein n=1 Tax=Luteolibacter soli TaxID=3135280 RepID=A0ABU9AQX4_9BACT
MNSFRWSQVLVFVASLAAGWGAMALRRPESAVPPVAPVPRAATGNSAEAAMAPLRAAKDRWTAIHAAIQLARDIPPQERLAWLDGGLFRHPDPLVVKLFMGELEGLLFNEDPYGFVADGIAKGRRTAVQHLARLAEQDAEGLIDFGKKLANPEQGRRMMFAGMKVLVDRDPAAVLALALEFPPPGNGEPAGEMTRLLAKAAGHDGEKLLNLADQRGDRWRAQLRAAAAQAMMTKDMGNAVRWLSTQPDGARLYAAAFDLAGGMSLEEMQAESKRVAEHLGDFSPKFAADLNRTIPGGWPGIRTRGCEELWLAADYSQLGFSKKQTADTLKSALGGLFSHDPVAAARYLSEHTDFPAKARQELIGNLEQRYGVTREEVPAELASFLTEAEFNRLKDAGMRSREKSQQPQKTPTVADEFAEAMSGPVEDALMLRSQWTPAQMEEAVAYVRNAPPEKLKEMADRLVYTGNPLQPIAAEIYRMALVKGVGNATTSEEMIEISIHWGGSDPTAASAWAESLPAGPERLCAVRNIASQWSFNDPAAAERWIAGLKDASEAKEARQAVKLAVEKSR